MPSTQIDLSSDVTVELVQQVGNDDAIIRAAQVSVVGHNEPEDFERSAGLINYLMREHHGSPFEHNSLTLYVKAPIFVFREFQRHRVGFSYNEMSGRYTELLPEFYIPNEDRPLQNVGSSAKPDFVAGTNLQTKLIKKLIPHAYRVSWKVYKTLLKAGVGNEVARIVLPVGIMSQMYVTMNLRSALNFLTLRTKGHPDASFVSRPQEEIAMVADQIEAIVSRQFPLAYAAFNKHGRVAP